MNKIHYNKNKNDSSTRVRPLFLGCGFIVRTIVALITVIILFAFISAPGYAAAPVVNSFSVAVTSANSLSIIVNKPTGTTEGDLLVAIMGTDGDGETLGTPGGWTAITGNIGINHTSRSWYKIAGASEPSSYTFTVSSSESIVCGILRISGHDPSNPIDLSGTATGSSNAPTCPDVTTTVADTLVLRYFGADDDDITQDSGYPSLHTGVYVRGSLELFGETSSGVAYTTQASLGATGTAAFSMTASEDWSAVTIAVIPQCDSGAFSYRKQITIDYTKVGLDNIGTLPATGFPVLIGLSGEWLQTTTVNPTNGRIESADGYDIIFRESDGRTGLYHEIESYDSQPSVEILDDWHGNGVDFQTSGLNHDPSAGTNRLVLIAVFAEEATATVSVDTVSLGGVDLNKIDEQVVGTGYSNNVWLGYLKDADIPAGTAITVTWVGGNVPDGAFGDPVHVQACTLQNVDQTSPVGNTGKEANTPASSIGSSAGQLNVADGDMVVYATVAGQPGDHTVESGYTEHLELDGVANNLSDATASKSITGTGTEQPVADWSLSTRLAYHYGCHQCGRHGKACGLGENRLPFQGRGYDHLHVLWKQLHRFSHPRTDQGLG